MSNLKVEIYLAWMLSLLVAATSSSAAEIDAGLMSAAARSGPVNVLLVFPSQQTPLLAPLADDVDYLEHRRMLVAALRARADTEQRATRTWLDTHSIEYRHYWIANVIATTLSKSDMLALRQRPDVARIAANPEIRQRMPTSSQAPAHRGGTFPWGLNRIRAPMAWAAGVTGAGVVVAGEDTGYDWDHPALKAHYRGWNGSAANHNYNWHDAIHVTGSSCGANSPAPCDDESHGTHTMGTMVGDDGGSNQIGVAPDATWIGCRNMNDGWGSPARYIECMQWMLAPTDLAGQNADPSKAPNVINNSWGCVFAEGCTVGDELDAAIQSLISGGIFYVASAGNDGPACSSIGSPPATYAGSFAVAAGDVNDSIASFSSRGPIVGASGVTLDITAPGVNVRSSVPGSGYGFKNGTSMAGPHVAGVAALVMSVNPQLRGDPTAVAAILRASAVRVGITDPGNSGCGGLDMNDWPNWQAGYGRLDAWAAVQLADTIFADGFND